MYISLYLYLYIYIYIYIYTYICGPTCCASVSEVRSDPTVVSIGTDENPCYSHYSIMKYI